MNKETRRSLSLGESPWQSGRRTEADLHAAGEGAVLSPGMKQLLFQFSRRDPALGSRQPTGSAFLDRAEGGIPDCAAGVVPLCPLLGTSCRTGWEMGADGSSPVARVKGVSHPRHVRRARGLWGASALAMHRGPWQHRVCVKSRPSLTEIMHQIPSCPFPPTEHLAPFL